eukprot:Skav203138  [mRNA]  locus=scaffold2505:92956:99812:- [translate_table: standard]
MGEASLITLFSDAGLLGGGLQRATTRSICQSLTNRRHFQTDEAKFCFQGQAEVRRRTRKEGLKRSHSVPPKIQGPQPYVSELTPQAYPLHFEDFQEVCLASAMHRNPNLVVPVENRFEQFLMAMVDGLKRRVAASKTEMLPHLVVEVKSTEADAKQRAWDEFLKALGAVLWECRMKNGDDGCEQCNSPRPWMPTLQSVNHRGDAGALRRPYLCLADSRNFLGWQRTPRNQLSQC